jgi:RNA polymerase sigma-70 factor (ECF subfamily)
VSRLAQHFESSASTDITLDEVFASQNIQDDQLRMIFTACHPALTKDSQVALTLKTLCGFSIPEIARAFFTTDDTINKRLVRARQKIREANIQFAVPAVSEMEERLEAVLETIYLLFNEGYSASTGIEPIRYELCEEAIRLAEMLSVHPIIKLKGNVFALHSLMLLNAARFRSRVSKHGDILTLSEQDRTLWDRSLMDKGFAYLQRSTEEKTISIYHILATISAYHCSARDFESTDWKGILSMYDRMLLLDNSPLVHLNRCIPLAKVQGIEKAIEQLQSIKENPLFTSYHLLYATEAEFYLEKGDYDKAARAFEKAIEYSTLPAEKDRLQRRLKECGEKSG